MFFIVSEFKSDVGKKSVVEPKKTSSNLSSLFSPVPVTSDTNPAIDKVVNKPKSRLSSLFDPTPCQPETKPEKIKPKSLLGSIFDDVDKSKPEQTSSVEPGAVSSGESGAAAEPRAASSEKPVTLDPGKVAITKVFDFAGEVVKITKEVDAESSEAKKFLKKQEETGPATSGIRKGGLASVVGSIGKKVKMGCLDKSKLDWNQFVTEEGIKEDLASHNRGKDGYVDKQMFLERADLRQFEIEKAIREKNRKSLMK
ncbi:craniofacial development protein 1 [Eurytemora carolleeae]|uniref:craniofacial development protein 1 n=1 Tax=Eurytemora carolleeae TaxID=1294199 RepID=UPI000C786BDF|nr:craniofacial development protein 1 [Eurytemora carolleeae]|eukprot:XP_023327574.1 craniofacial development protein 1-like [Eurytemora affinis]